MQSLASIAIKSYLKLLRAFRRRQDLTLSEQRNRLEHFAGIFRVPKTVRIESTRINQISVEWITPDDCSSDAVILYKHGGAYCAGSLNTHRAFLGRLALECGCKVLNVDYRLAPESPFPAALDDVFVAYNYLIKTFPAEKIVLAGDSADGGLSIALAMKLRDEKITLAAACVLMAPWVDGCTAEPETPETKCPDVRRC
ncbi:MAG: alpha/beta hydrolase fold domain-containing protein [Candidatus Marinimicrobia bacterium]|nr:alpha/beta hydrolase fold domain-containing protein [Candidatus Neomarinimicrobiota bacterium]